MKRGRPPGMNLHAVGYEAAAEDISERCWKRNAPHHCWVLPDGGVIVRQCNEGRFDEPAVDCLVGTYTKLTKVEYIEDDLIERLRELTIAQRKAA